jgi:hypothetical protein
LIKEKTIKYIREIWSREICILLFSSSPSSLFTKGLQTQEREKDEQQNMEQTSTKTT